MWAASTSSGVDGTPSPARSRDRSRASRVAHERWRTLAEIATASYTHRPRALPPLSASSGADARRLAAAATGSLSLLLASRASTTAVKALLARDGDAAAALARDGLALRGLTRNGSDSPTHFFAQPSHTVTNQNRQCRVRRYLRSSAVSPGPSLCSAVEPRRGRLGRRCQNKEGVPTRTLSQLETRARNWRR